MVDKIAPREVQVIRVAVAPQAHHERVFIDDVHVPRLHKIVMVLFDDINRECVQFLQDLVLSSLDFML